MYYEGKLLVAPPTMRDWRFRNSVVYLWKHDYSGAAGIILNKQLEQPTFRDVCAEGNIPLAEGIDTTIHYGGPVGLQMVGCLHTLDWASPNTNTFDTELGFTLDRQAVASIAQGRGPQQYIVTMGIASWETGQLEDEIESTPPRRRDDSWLVMDFDPNIVWHGKIQHMWNSCVSIAVSESSRDYVSRFLAD